MRRKYLIATAIAAGLIVAGVAWHASTSDAQVQINGNANGKKVVEGPLPIRQVVLFNSGVGYFQREGEVDGNAQVELSFPTTDINDLLKSLVLQDLGGGKISTVSYDSHDPIDKILRSFALDLNGNPSFGQLLNQARGEKIELMVKGDKGQTTKINGTIVGMEVKRRPIGKDGTQVMDMETLNISGPNGLQGVNLEDVLGVRFLNATLENEFQRALRVLAQSHDTQKKIVSLGFNGPGKRAVRVGYVVERPLWKTSYRLRIEPNGKIFMQGWAMVENTSDDDWNNVRMVLVSGRPISYQMNLYEPIYIPRPLVEPEMFASLRPPVYGGAMAAGEEALAANQPRANLPAPVAQGGAMPPGATPQQQLFLQQQLANPMGGMPGNFGMNFANPMFQGGGQGGGFGGGGFGGGGFQGQGGFNNAINPYNQKFNVNNDMNFNLQNNRLTFDELQRRRQQEVAQKQDAKAKGAMIAGLNFKEGIASVASAEEVGDYYQYIIDQKVTLSRQKSAMLPILDQTIDGAKVSIFNEATHAKFPLLGLRLKNTSGQPLTQGPITVYDNQTYAGDTRILDLQPNEERLLSYALDQSTEVKTDVKSTPSPDMIFRLGEPNLSARYKLRQTKTYTIKNRSTHDRTVVVEHPVTSEWKLVDMKPAEKTRSHYRFNVAVASGKTVAFDVVEEQARVDHVALTAQPTPLYAVSIGVHVKPMIHVHEEKLTALKIQKGFVMPTLKSRETRSYHVQNLSEQDRTFTVDHVIRKEWSVIDPADDPKAGPEVYRFKLAVAKGKTGTREINEERIRTEKGTLIKDVPQTKLREYLAHAVPSADVKAALNKALTLQTKLSDSSKQLAELEKNLKTVSDDQARLRKNLEIIPQTSEPYKKFLEKFVAQETEIEGLQKSIRQEQTTMQATQREYDAFIANLNAE